MFCICIQYIYEHKEVDKYTEPIYRIIAQGYALRGFSIRAEKTYLYWIRCFIYYSGKRHPAELGAAEVKAFFSLLATDRHVAINTQNGPSLPYALGKKYPNAYRSLQWAFIFPSTTLCKHLVTGETCRHHLHPSVARKALQKAAKYAGTVTPLDRLLFATDLNR